MKIIKSEEITEKVAAAFIEANFLLPGSVCEKIREAVMKTEGREKNILRILEENISASKKYNVPVCQDTGMAVVFAKLGRDVYIEGDILPIAVNKGVRRAYVEGGLRLSVVADPLRRINTETNTPAIIHTEQTEGETLEIICLPKGFGSENSSRLKMFEPSAGADDIIEFITETVRTAGSNPCPPVIVGVGIGGDFEYCALLAKLALTREAGELNKDEIYAGMEKNALEKINSTGIGAQGFGGMTTALAVHIEQFPTHIAGLPVAVNICCHVYRHKKIVI